MNKAREELEKAYLKALQASDQISDEEKNKVLLNLLQCISNDVSAAVGKTNHINVPLIIFVLERTVSAIKSQYPGMEDIVSDLGKCFCTLSYAKPVSRKDISEDEN